MKSKVKKVTIRGGETTYSRPFPIEFNSLEEVNGFLLSNINRYSKGGYCKNDMMVEWENGETYSYRADLSHPEGNCYSSLEYNVGARIKYAAINMVKGYEEKGERWLNEKQVEEIKNMLATCVLTEETYEELEQNCVEDEEVCKQNRERQQKERYAVEWVELKEKLNEKRSTSEIIGKRETFETNQYKVESVKGKYIEWSGTIQKTNPATGESESVKVRRVFKVGETANAEYASGYGSQGTITNITAKSVLLTITKYGGESKRRVRLENFVSLNNNSSQRVESVEYEQGMYEIYSR